MQNFIRVYDEKGNFLFDEQMSFYGNDFFVFKWKKLEKAGSYSFKIAKHKNYEGGLSVYFDHTAPFDVVMEAYAAGDKVPKPISGFKKDDDILITYNKRTGSVVIKRIRFTRFVMEPGQYGFKTPKKVEMPASFNNWVVYADELKQIDETRFETYLALEDGVYEYKFVVDGEWVPNGANEKLIVGELGSIFPEGKFGNGNFVYDAKNPYEDRKAIKHDPYDLVYLNRTGGQDVSIVIRTQLNDVEKIILHINENNEIEEVYEMERNNDVDYGFDYFKKNINLRINKEKFKYYFELIDGGEKAYFTPQGLLFGDFSCFEIDYVKGDFPYFDVPDWAKSAVWYNIFPDRFYNGDSTNDPVYNQFGPEAFDMPYDKERFGMVDENRWGIADKTYGRFDCHEWTADFEDKKVWEKRFEKEAGYSVKYARMYGGDLEGIRRKIPYLKKLGIDALWLNPVFFAESNHKYGAADFRHISPDFGTIKITGVLHDIKVAKDNCCGNKNYIDVLGNNAVGKSELDLLRMRYAGEDKGRNGYKETEAPETWVWTESDLIAVKLIKELHANGIRVIFDGVFNHSGTAHWAFEDIMINGSESKYLKWYRFHDTSKLIHVTEQMDARTANRTIYENKKHAHYSGWYGFKDLPEFNSYNDEVKEYLFNITKKWMLGPDGVVSDNWMENDGIDGWRLDVPNCLENQGFWHEWRKVVKETNREAYITAELWGDARNEINKGNKYDTVMNYEWLKATIGYFINRGNVFNKSYKLKADEFFKELKTKRNWYPLQSVQVSQNLNGSHDTDRLLSRIVNDKLGRDLEEGKQWDRNYNTLRPDLAAKNHSNTSYDWRHGEIKPKEILKLISIFQMTYVGAPMLYYGDEVGMWGATDPYCRKPMLWEEFTYYDETDGTKLIDDDKREKYQVKPDMELYEWYSRLINIRKSNKTLATGEFKEILADNERDIIVYERYDDDNHFVIMINNSAVNYNRVSIFSDFENEEFQDLLGGKRFISDPQGNIELDLPRKSGVILKKI